MPDRPIIFSAPMIRALLNGSKSQTRRILKPQPDDLVEGQIPAALRIQYGDRLWVREAWRAPIMNDDVAPRDLPAGMARAYEADSTELIGRGDDTTHSPIGAAGRLRPGIHMPRWASRLTLVVTDARVERLQSMSAADAMAEGIQDLRTPDHTDYGIPGLVNAKHPVRAFWVLWESINGPGTWEANPWVAAISFDVHRANIDALAKRGVRPTEATSVGVGR